MTQENLIERIKGPRLGWRDNAACIGQQELFFSDHKLTVVMKAKQICATCTVKEQCLEHAMLNSEFGVWGGLTANERRRKRREMRKRKLTVSE